MSCRTRSVAFYPPSSRVSSSNSRRRSSRNGDGTGLALVHGGSKRSCRDCAGGKSCQEAQVNSRPVTEHVIRQHLDKVLSSHAFAHADRLKRFLAFVVNESAN